MIKDIIFFPFKVTATLAVMSAGALITAGAHKNCPRIESDEILLHFFPGIVISSLPALASVLVNTFITEDLTTKSGIHKLVAATSGTLGTYGMLEVFPKTSGVKNAFKMFNSEIKFSLAALFDNENKMYEASAEALKTTFKSLVNDIHTDQAIKATYLGSSIVQSLIFDWIWGDSYQEQAVEINPMEYNYYHYSPIGM